MNEKNNKEIDSIELTEEKYKTLLRIFSIIGEYCTDIDITNGVVRQKASSGKCRFEMNLKSLIGERSLPISIIKEKIKVFKLLDGNVKIFFGDNFFMFQDSVSSFNIKKPSRDFFSNKFEEESVLRDLGEIEGEVVEFSIPKELLKKIRVVVKEFNVDAVSIRIDKSGKGVLFSSKNTNDSRFLFTSEIKSSMDFGEVVTINLKDTTFVIDCDDDLHCFINKLKEKEQTINIFQTKISDIDLRMYSTSVILR